MWTSQRRLFLLSLRFSSFSRTPSPYVVPSSHLLSSCNYSSHAPLTEDDVRVSVWWNSDQCKLPDRFRIEGVNPAITAALRANGIKGPIEINGFGDLGLLSKDIPFIEINFVDVPGAGSRRTCADEVLRLKVLRWVAENPPPAHLFFICSGSSLAYLLHELRMKRYNVLLASDDAPVELRSVATMMWDWNPLVSGEKLIGKHLNYPPDGSIGYWYGRFIVPTEDPFSTYSPNTETRFSSKAILNELKGILKSHPEGLSLEDLLFEFRSESKCSLQEFFRLILSAVPILQFKTRDGKTLASLPNHLSTLN